jgi:hypothetical protein
MYAGWLLGAERLGQRGIADFRVSLGITGHADPAQAVVHVRNALEHLH